MRSDFKFERVPDEQLMEAFDVLQRAIAWTRKMGRKQRIAETTIATYRRWQSNESNFAVSLNGRIVGVATLIHEPLHDWPEFEELGCVQMLRALATCPQHRGRHIGEFAVRQIVERFGSADPVFLDCVHGFLPDYYGRQGFEFVSTRNIAGKDSEHYEICLLRHSSKSS